MRMIIVWLTLVGIFGSVLFASADMSSNNFLIRTDTISQGGADDSSSASFFLRDTIGNAGAGDSSSTTYDLRAGYRQGIYDQVLAFAVAAQDESSGRAATALSGTTITASTTGLAVGDLIVLIQNEGDSQVSAMGRIASIGSGTFTVDALKNAGTAPTIDGANDIVYVLDTSAISFGELNQSTVTTRTVGFEVTADIPNGYAVQVFDDGDLRDGGDTINDVADGDVAAGEEEYGGRSSDTSLADSAFDTADGGFSPLPQDVATESDVRFEDRNFVTLKASISASTSDGAYAQTLSFIVSGVF